MSEAEVRTRLVDLFWSDTITLISAVRAKWLKTLAFYTLQEAQNVRIYIDFMTEKVVNPNICSCTVY